MKISLFYGHEDGHMGLYSQTNEELGWFLSYWLTGSLNLCFEGALTYTLVLIVYKNRILSQIKHFKIQCALSKNVVEAFQSRNSFLSQRKNLLLAMVTYRQDGPFGRTYGESQELCQRIWSFIHWHEKTWGAKRIPLWPQEGCIAWFDQFTLFHM